MTAVLSGHLRRRCLEASSRYVPALAVRLKTSVSHTTSARIARIAHEPRGPLSSYPPRIFSSSFASSWEVPGLKTGLRQANHNHEVTMLINMIRQNDWSKAMEALDSSGIHINAMHVVDIIRLEANPQYALRFFLWAGCQEGYAHKAVVISAITRVWGHEKDFKAFLDILANMHLDDYTMISSKYLVLLRGYCWAGLTGDAMSILEWMISSGTRPDEKHFNCVLAALLKEKQLQAAEIILTKMKQVGVPVDVVTYATLVDCSCKSGCVQFALKYFSEMLKNGIRPDSLTYAAIFGGLCKLGEVDKALKAYEEVKNIEADTVALNALMAGLCDHRHILKSIEFFSSTRCKPDARTYEILISALCKCKNIKGARKFVEEALTQGFTFDSAVCTALLESLCLACKDKEACDVMNMLVSQCNVTDATGNMVVASLCRNGEVYSAYRLWYEALRLKCISVNTYEALLEGLCKEGRLTFLKQVYDHMISKGLTPSANVHGALVDGFCRAGNFDCAWKILNELMDRGSSPNVEIFNSLIRGFSEAGQMSKAKLALQKMEDAGCFPILYTYIYLINGYCKVQLPDNALILLKRMLAQDYEPDEGTISNLIQTFCRVSKVDAAYVLFKDMKGRGFKADVQVYESLIGQLCRVNEVDDAHTLLLELLDRGVKPYRLVSGRVIECLRKLGRVEDANNLMDMLS